MKGLNYTFWAIAGLSLFMLSSCQEAEGNKTGSEYFPDMFHSIAFEANVYDYYYYNTWSSPEEYYKNAQPRTPVAGTIPFGQFGMTNGQYSPQMENVIKDLNPSGSVPFHYLNNEEGRSNAATEIRKNPYPITEEGLNNGKALYGIYCGICHGQKGDGLGYLVRDDGGKYPVAPADLTSDKFIDTTAGLYIYAIVHGKNVMGSYADKLSEKERWDVIHHIRQIQADKVGKIYTPEVNTFVPDEAMTMKQVGVAMMDSGSSAVHREDDMESTVGEESGGH